MAIARLRVMAAAAFAAAVLVGTAGAQWSGDPATNTPVAATPGVGEVLCKIAATPDGGCWVSWFVGVGSPTFYNVRLQRLDAEGNKTLGPSGLLVSDHPHQSSLVDYDLRCDSAGNALIAFTDVRDGGTDREVSVYRISPSGTFLWGPNGVLLSSNTNFEADPRICETSDGNFCVVWPRTDQPSGQPPRGLIMQRLDAAGNKLLGADGVLIAGNSIGGAGEIDAPAFCEMVPSDNGSVIVLFAKDTRLFASPRHPTIQKYDTTGAGLWNGGNVITLAAASIPIGNRMQLVSDGASGAVPVWYDNRGTSGRFSCWAQRLNAAGVQAFPAGGAAVSTNYDDRQHLSPSDAVIGPDGETYVFWREINVAQSQWGVYGQRFDAAGARQWGDSGLEVAPVDTTNDSFVRAVSPPSGGGAIVVFKSEPNSGVNNDTMKAVRLDGDGAMVWDVSPRPVSTAAADFGRMPITRASDGGVMLAWEDNRADSQNDIYAQRIDPAGFLGAAAVPPCPADYNGLDGVTVQDIYDFLADWSAAIAGGTPTVGNPDFNGVDGVTVQDIYDFLAAWNSGCP